MRMIVVGGVPGAGKSTVLRPYAGRADLRVLDPDALRGRLRHRPLVHLAHQVLVWGSTLLGPDLVGTLLVHDTATRPRRLGRLLRLARWRGWETSVVLLDVARTTALTGQVDRGRLTPAAAFERHWQRWCRHRGAPAAPGVATLHVTRGQAASVVAAMLRAEPRSVAEAAA